MFHGPGTTPDRILEIVTPEWQYYDTDEYNFSENRIVPVKEQRRMGTQRGNKTTPQAPAIEVRAKGLPNVPVACRCRLWNFGSCLEKEPPRHDGTATQLTMLRVNVQIDVTENVAMFGPVQDDGYRYARLRCFITRGARVQCRKFHIAFYLDCVYLPHGSATPGLDDSSFAVGDLVEHFPWTRSARMSISEKAMCPRMHDKTKRAKKASKNHVTDGSGSPDSIASDSSPKRLKKTPSSLDTPTNNQVKMLNNSTANSVMNTNKKGSKMGDPLAGIPHSNVPPQQSANLGNPMMMPHLPGTGIPQATPNVYSNYLDRHLRMSRFSFPGLEDEMFQHATGVADDGDLVNMESALGHGRRSSQFIGGQYWPSYQQSAYYLNQPGHGQNAQHQQHPHHQLASANTGVNGNTPTSLGGTSPLSNQSPPFVNLHQGGFPSLDFSGIGELSQRRLSTAGQWGNSGDLQSRRVSAIDIGRFSNPPMSLPPNQPGRGPEWEALFEAHSKVLSLDKSSPDYLTQKNNAMAEVYRTAELVEQRILQRK